MFTIDGVPVKDDDVLFDGKVHHRYCENTPNGTYLLSCETGYTHDLTQEFISTLKNVGTFKGNEHLFECD